MGEQPLVFDDEWNLDVTDHHSADAHRSASKEVSGKSGDKVDPDTTEEKQPSHKKSKASNPMTEAEERERKRQDFEAKQREYKKMEATDDKESARAFIKSVESYVAGKANERRKLEHPCSSGAPGVDPTHEALSRGSSRLLCPLFGL